MIHGTADVMVSRCRSYSHSYPQLQRSLRIKARLTVKHVRVCCGMNVI